MSLGSSIVRGFGFTLGRKAANVAIDYTSQSPQKSSQIDCWSHNGYQEGDVEIFYDYDYLRKQIKWYQWVLFVIPIVGLLKSLSYFYNVFLKKNMVKYYDMKWETFTVSDGRTKSGIREIKKLKPQLGKVEVAPPYLRNKIESIVALLITLLFNLPILIGLVMTIMDRL
jgi:hypothetical protein